MQIPSLILSIILSYILLAFVIPYIILPDYLIPKPKTRITNPGLKAKIKELSKIKPKEKFLKSVFLFVAKKYDSSQNPLTFISHLPRLFWHNPNKLFDKSGFAYCHSQNLMIETILLESKCFKKEDIKKKIVIFNPVIHQYLLVKINGKSIELDPWAYHNGIPYGKHENWLNFFSYR